MSTSGSSLLLHLNLLMLGARSGLPARCEAVDGRGERRAHESNIVDATFALQYQVQQGEKEIVPEARSAVRVSAASPADYHPLPDLSPASAHNTGDHFAIYGHAAQAGDATFPSDGFSGDLGSHHLDEIGNWVPSDWGPCQGGCQPPVRTRQVLCRSILNYSVISDSWCHSSSPSPKPIKVESCSCSPVGLEVCSPLAESCLAPQDEYKEFHMSVMPGYVELGCFELAPRDSGAAQVCVQQESRDTSCETWRFPMPCRSGFPFYTFCRNLEGAEPAVEAHMFERECFEKCIHKGMDMAAVVEGKECRCGASPNNVAVWRSDTAPVKKYFNIDSVFAVKALSMNYGSTCPLKVLRYTGAYETGFVPIQYFDANILDQAYVDSMVLGHDVVPESEEEKPNLDFTNYDVDRTAVGGGDNRSSADPAWLRPCYPSNCASSRGPWMMRQTEAPAGMPSGVNKAWEEYTIVPYMFEDGVQPMDETRKEAFRAAAAEWASHTCIVLKEAASATALDSSGNYISVKVEDVNYCYVNGGLGYGTNTINMGWCSTMSHVGNIVHEIGHALGMLHEQQRQDAQKEYHGHGPHLDIFWDQIDSAWKSQYLPVDTSYIGSGHDRDRDPWDAGYAPYDFGSLMHYPSAQRFNTIPADELSKTGQRTALSDGDIRQINDMYQCIQEDGATPQPTEVPAAPEVLIVSGACQFQSGLNGEWVRAGYTKTGHAYYMKDWRSLYYDHSCNGAGFTSTWVFDSTEPDVTRDSDLDNDGVCSFIGYHFSASDLPHLGDVEWSIFCGSWFDPVTLKVEVGFAPTAAPTLAPGHTEAPTPAPASSLGFTVADACTEKVYLDGAYSAQGLTASGLPYYKHDQYPLYVYWDLHCDGASFPSAWVFDNNAPSTSAESDLDGDGQCSFFGFMESPQQLIEPGQNTFNIYCTSWIPVDLTFTVAAAPTPAPTLAPTPPPTLEPTPAPTPPPTPEPTPAPTMGPTASPTTQPTAAPTASPTALPTTAPTAGPTAEPTPAPTAGPTMGPTVAPTASPTALPSAAPTASPTALPTSAPTAGPTAEPTPAPTAGPTIGPTVAPAASPTALPTTAPTAGPTALPTAAPTAGPTALPTTAPTAGPTAEPTPVPTAGPAMRPTVAPTASPTALPSAAPTAVPIASPRSPTAAPTAQPTAASTASPTALPTAAPTPGPTGPTAMPTPGPTETPVYISYLEFIVEGIDYSTLAASQEVMTAFTTKVAKSTCSSIGLPAYNCSVIVFAGSVKVGVTIGSRSSYEDASVLAAALQVVNETLQADVVESFTNDTAIMAAADSISIATSQLNVSIITTTPQSDGSSGSSDNEASATGDPHISSVTGKKFDVNLPGGYVLIRAPQDQRLPAKLEVNATLEPSAGAPCGLYIKSIRLGGEWLANRLVEVLPLQRDVEGGNGVGSRTVRPFSVRVQEGPRQAASSAYEQWKEFDKRGRLLTGRVRLVPVWRQVHADAGRTQEAEAFRFNVRGEGAEQATSLEVAQGAHQALDVRAGGLRRLGFERLGGLLGTEEHDRRVEQFTDECKAQRMSATTRVRKNSMAPLASSMAASWDELLD